MFESFPILHTSKLILREIDYRDIKDIFNILSDEISMTYYGMYPIATYDRALWFIERYRLGFEEKRMIRWAIVLKENHQLIGTCGFHSFNDYTNKIEVGYELHHDYHRMGYMTEALNTIIDWAFLKLGAHRIEAMIYPENNASIQLIKKCGFTYEGLLRDYAFFRNQYTSLELYSILEGEYFEKNTHSW